VSKDLFHIEALNGVNMGTGGGAWLCRGDGGWGPPAVRVERAERAGVGGGQNGVKFEILLSGLLDFWMEGRIETARVLQAANGTRGPQPWGRYWLGTCCSIGGRWVVA